MKAKDRKNGSFYFCGILFLIMGNISLIDYLKNGYIINRKDEAIYRGTEALVISLAIIAFGVINLIFAVYSSHKYKGKNKVKED